MGTENYLLLFSSVLIYRVIILAIVQQTSRVAPLTNTIIALFAGQSRNLGAQTLRPASLAEKLVLVLPLLIMKLVLYSQPKENSLSGSARLLFDERLCVCCPLEF